MNRSFFVALLLVPFVAAAAPMTPDELRKVAREYYDWSDKDDPVAASEQGKHTWDDKLTDLSPAAILARDERVGKLLERVRAVDPVAAGWKRDDVIDWILFRSQLENRDFARRVLRATAADPGLYVGTASSAIFSLIKKDYAPPAVRARAATARLAAVPHLLEQARTNLTAPVRLYAQLAAESARAIDPLYRDSLAPLARELKGAELAAFTKARDAAIAGMHAFADWLDQRAPSMAAWRPMGEAAYNEYLARVLILPLDAREVAALGEIELARYRALEAMLKDPSLADPDPRRAAKIPADQQAFLAAYQSRQEEMIRFLRERQLVTLPPYLGPFLIRQLPEAFKPTSPGGFMNPPGREDPDPSGFFFIPTYDPKSSNFYLRAAIEDPRPILGHEGIPGHFLQLSIANHLTNDIRRHHDDNLFIEGWALYGEEMLARTGLYPPDSAAAAQVLRLSRYRAARIGVDVNLHTGRFTFDEAVRYFQEAGGLDVESATGEAAGAATSPHQKISYLTGKWQILRLLGRYRDRKGAGFRLGQFHDDLLANGSLPLSVVAWILLDDPGDLEKATGLRLAGVRP